MKACALSYSSVILLKGFFKESGLDKFPSKLGLAFLNAYSIPFK
jgi:hypothetical protein